jgi:carboxyl-terminal processing protease
VAGLEDPHTDYLTPAEYESIQDTTEGTYSGVGLTVGPARRGLLVTSALRGPAREAGIRKGDVIVSIDGERVGTLPFDRSLALIKGETGTLVRLTVRRPRRGTMDFTVMRQDIDVPPISARMMKVGKAKVAYVRVFAFPDGAAERIERATTTLVEEGARGAIVDLRDNPGGLFTQAVSSASIYLEEGIVCRTDGVHEEAQTYNVTGNATHPELPLVVLVNGGSASAAEILAGALYDYDRATLVGERTYGKASVQTIAPLRNGGALKLTTAKYVTPAGADITGRGIHPGIVAADDPLTDRDEALLIARRTLADVLAAG